MKSAAAYFVNHQPAAAPVAQIDAWDEEFVGPIRDFFKLGGCAVVVNQKSSRVPEYHLICGDTFFVKKIFAEEPKSVRGHFVVLVDGSLSEAQSLLDFGHTKVAIVNPGLISPRDTEALFAFFFTTEAPIESSKILKSLKPLSLSRLKPVADLGPAAHREAEKEPWSHPPSELQPSAPLAAPSTDASEADRQRIQASIDSIYRKIPKPIPGRASSGQPPPETGQMARPTAARKPGDSRPPRARYWLVAGGLSAVLVALPLVYYLVALSVASVSLVWGAGALRRGNTVQAAQASNIARYSAQQAANILGMMAPPFKLVGWQERLRGQERLASFLDDIAAVEQGLGGLIISGKDLAGLLLTPSGSLGQTPSPAIVIDRLRIDLLFVQRRISLAQAQLQALRADNFFPFSLAPIQALATKVQKVIDKLERSVVAMETLSTLYPTLAGFKETKNYLVLWQNSLELRPTGGFIGSLATATFAEGRLTDLVIQDVYTIDGQLKGHVDPPVPIRDLLGEEHWYLRDANWDPDFARSGQQVAWFYEKETGRRVDGVIGISVPVITDLLAVTGPLELPDYNDRITAGNFFGKSLFYTRADFFPGSTQKKDFLGSLTSALLSKITAGKGISGAALWNVLVASLERGDILLNFADREAQAIVERIGWAGRLPLASGCREEEGFVCASDRAAVIEANLGVNKVNYFLQRIEQHQVVLAEDGSSESLVSVSYRNTSTSDHPSSGGGTYHAYVRFFLPPQARLSAVTVDGQPINPPERREKTAPTLPYMEEDRTNAESLIIGVALDVAPRSEKRLAVSFSQAHALDFGKNGAIYNLRIQKQPGLTNTTLDVSVTYPIFWNAAPLAGEINYPQPEFGRQVSLAKEGRFEYNTSLSRHQEIKIRFTK